MAVGIEVQNFLMIAIVLSMFSMLFAFDVHFQLVHREYITCVFSSIGYLKLALLFII